MTDRRATDLSYGHLGEATYDTVEKKWTFSRVPVLSSIIQPIQPLQRCITPSAQPTLKTTRNHTDRASNRVRDQKRSLVRDLPQLGAATTILGPLVRAASLETSHSRLTSGNLIARGTAKVLLHTSRSIDVLAIAHGEAGQALRLIKPRVDHCTWDEDDSAKLRILNPSISEDGYWLDGAGSIEQIVFSSDTEGARSWLAVRKVGSTTILKPEYRESPVPASVPANFQERYRPSRLDPNPIATITTAMTNGRNHADVAFNPWYPRQFAVLDEDGYWSAWDIEGRKIGKAKIAKPGKSGYIYDNQDASEVSQERSSNGWGSILWAGNVSTIVVCNERHLAVFDLKSRPVRLRSPDLVPNGSFGRILEVKRSPLQFDQIFVLTNSRLFLVQIDAAGELRGDENGYPGARIIMSCLHYREAQGNLLKLELHGDDNVCTTFLTSSAMALVNVYKFISTPDAATPVTWSTDAFYLSPGLEGDTPSKIIGICVLPVAFEDNESLGISRFGGSFKACGNRFLQIFTLGENLEVSQTLLAESRLLAGPEGPARYEQILPPSESRPAPADTTSLSTRTVDDFVVPDGFEDYESGSELLTTPLIPSVEDSASTRPEPKLIDARRWYEIGTIDKVAEPADEEEYPTLELGMADYVQNIVGGIQHRRQVEQEGLWTLHDLSGFEKFTEDVDDGSALLQDFISSFEANYAESSMNITLRSAGLLKLLDLEPNNSSSDSLPELSKVYDKLINLWVASLPQNTPGLTRIAKEKTVRNIAADLCLSSLLVSIRDKSVPLPAAAPPAPEDGPSLTLPIHGGPPPVSSQTSVSPYFPSSQPSHDNGFFPLSRHSTLPPSDMSDLAGEPAEDPAIARLRGYALSIKSLKPLGATRASILEQWPEIPGSDPETYVWRPELVTGPGDEEEGESDEDAASQREEKRRRRTERFLKKQWGAGASGGMGTVVSSQSAVESQLVFRGAASSQIAVGSSSQVEVGISMTQPSAGLFGSRSGLGKKKKRKTGF